VKFIILGIIVVLVIIGIALLATSARNTFKPSPPVRIDNSREAVYPVQYVPVPSHPSSTQPTSGTSMQPTQVTVPTEEATAPTETTEQPSSTQPTEPQSEPSDAEQPVAPSTQSEPPVEQPEAPVEAPPTESEP